MDQKEATIRHLLDLCRKSEKTGMWQFSGFLSPAEQEEWLRSPDSGRFSFLLAGGHEAAERKILAAGSEAEAGPPDYPISVVAIRPKSMKYAEELSHRDYLGAMMSLGIDRSLTGDILIRDKRAWIFCLSSAAEMLASSLTQIRKTAVAAEVVGTDVPEILPSFTSLRLNVASGRLDAVIAAFAGISRGQAEKLFAAEKVFVNGLPAPDKGAQLKEGDILSVRGIGKAIYDGIEHETKKGRLWVALRKYS